MKRFESRTIRRMIAAGLLIATGSVAVSACGDGYSPSTERGMERVIDPALIKIGTKILAFDSRNPDNCDIITTNKKDFEVTCTDDTNSRGLGDQFGSLQANMKTKDGKPMPDTTYYVDIMSGSTYSGKSSVADMTSEIQLVSPFGDLDAHEVDNSAAGWIATQGSSTGSGSNMGAGGYDTSSSQDWVLNNNFQPSSAVYTARTIVGNTSSELQLAEAAF